MAMVVPTGRLKGKQRDFHEIVFEMRHCVSSVVRERQIQGGFKGMVLGTGFFVAPDIFLTCDHVINHPDNPHQPGDSYMLVSNLTGTSGTLVRLTNPQVGNEINLFPTLDLAVLRVPHRNGQPFVAVSYEEVYEGQDIGVVGYPLPELRVVNGDLALDGLLYRAARGHVTGRYVASMSAAIQDSPILEVNFLFVPGNSGGPVFNAETGRVLGFVRGFRHEKIWEDVATVTRIKQLPLGVSNQYVASMNAIYSLAIKLDFVRATIEGFGVTL